MRNSTIVFSFFGIVIVFAIIFSAVILPRMDFGRNNIDIRIAFPVSKADIRYIELGIRPFCIENNNGITVETRENSPVFAPIDGLVTSIEENRVSIKKDQVYVTLASLSNLRISQGSYVTTGDIVGYVDENTLTIVLDNYNDNRYECPYLYMNNDGKKILTDGLLQSINNTKKICECSYLAY